MIVVIGSIGLAVDGADRTQTAPIGMAAAVALAAAASGRQVELIAKVGDDQTGDQLLIDLAGSRVGHAAVLRDPVRPTPRRNGLDTDPGQIDIDARIDGPATGAVWEVDPADGPHLDPLDTGLALQYLTDQSVLVAVHPSVDVLRQAVAAADWSGAHLVIVIRPGDQIVSEVPAGALVLSSGDDVLDASGLADRLGAYVAAIDRGDDRVAAYSALTAAPAAG
jgi:sugar/nucleoside kinase (ribokinase family)